MSFEYFYGAQSEQFSFYRIPKALFVNPEFKNVSSEAKILYGLLLDRMNLSAANGWHDEYGRVFIIFTIEDIMKLLGCADQKVSKLLNELDKKAGLIERKRQGLGKPNLIYVKNFISEINKIQETNEEVLNRENHDSGNQIDEKKGCSGNDIKSFCEESAKINGEEVKKGTYDSFLNRDFHDSRNSKITIQDYPKSRCNNTDINNTEFIDIDSNPILSDDRIRWDDPKTRIHFSDKIRHSIELDELKVKYPLDSTKLDEIFEIMVDTVCSKRKTVRVDSDDKPIDVVRRALLKIDNNHIEYVLRCLEENRSKIKNIKKYILTALYNAPLTISTYYSSLVNHDMASYSGL